MLFILVLTTRAWEIWSLTLGGLSAVNALSAGPWILPILLMTCKYFVRIYVSIIRQVDTFVGEGRGI